MLLLITLVGIAAITLIVLGVWLLPTWWITGVPTTPGTALSTADALKAQNDFRHSIIETAQVIATIFTAAAVVATLYFTSRNVSAAERTARVAEQTAQQNLQMQRETRFGERFTKAVDQLSSPSCGVRVGAVHTLARVAQESQEDHWPIVELLTALLREQRRVGVATDYAVAAPPEDVRAIASFIRTRRVEHERPGQFIDLSLTNLDDLDFDGARLAGSDLSSSELGGTRFRNADLSGATLLNTNAAGSIFSDACLREAFLNGAVFTRAHMAGVDLADASVTNATFESFVGPIKNVTEEQRKSAKIWTEANT